MPENNIGGNNMKNRLFVSFILIFLILLAIPVFASGSQSGNQARPASGVYQRDSNLNAPGTLPIAKTTVPLRIGVEHNPRVENFQTNWQVLQLERNANFKLTFEVYPMGELNQKIELMVMAGGADLPDMVWGDQSLGVVTKYGQAGMVIRTNDYWQTSAYYYNQRKGEFTIDLLKYITSYDGNIYGMFGILESIQSDYASWMMIYEPWLQKLNLEMPKTIADFTNVLRAFRDRDPNGNGLKDEIPVIGEKDSMFSNFLRPMMNPFIYTQPDYWILNNGRIDVAFNKPQWREGLRYAKSLFDEGLVSPLSFTQDSSQMTGLISQSNHIIGSFARWSGSNIGVNDPKRLDYIVLAPLEGPGGRQWPWTPVMPRVNTLITKNCKTPEAAFALCDYMYSEEMSLLNRFGEKGVDWLEPAPGDVSAFGAVGFPASMKQILAWGILQNKILAETGPRMIQGKWANGTVPGGLDHMIPIGRSIGPVIQAANRNPITGLIYNEREQQVMDEFHSTIISYVNQSYARFVTGDLSIDRDWDNYVAQFERMGLREVLGAVQSCWDRVSK